MKTVRVTMSDASFDRLKKIVKAEKHAGIASLLLARVNEQNEESVSMDIAKQAIQFAMKKKVGVKFRLKDLFPKKWETLGKGVRIRAGRQFLTHITADRTLGIEALARTGHQYYIRSQI